MSYILEAADFFHSVAHLPVGFRFSLPISKREQIKRTIGKFLTFFLCQALCQIIVVIIKCEKKLCGV